MESNNYPNWFKVTGERPFSKYLVEFRDSEVDFLQVGAYTGDATLWLFENVLTHPKSSLTDVDTWRGSEEKAHARMDWTDVEAVYDSRTQRFSADGRLTKVKTTSDRFFAWNSQTFDFIYVDADHNAVPVLKDGLNAFTFLKPNGILAFDDYNWRSDTDDVMRTPRPAIDTLLRFLESKVSVIEIGSQVWLRKKPADIR